MSAVKKSRGIWIFALARLCSPCVLSEWVWRQLCLDFLSEVSCWEMKISSDNCSASYVALTPRPSQTLMPLPHPACANPSLLRTLLLRPFSHIWSTVLLFAKSCLPPRSPPCPPPLILQWLHFHSNFFLICFLTMWQPGIPSSSSSDRKKGQGKTLCMQSTQVEFWNLHISRPKWVYSCQRSGPVESN